MNNQLVSSFYFKKENKLPGTPIKRINFQRKAVLVVILFPATIDNTKKMQWVFRRSG
jgi:hypothetical protein